MLHACYLALSRASTAVLLPSRTPLVDALRANGSDIQYLESQGCLPLSTAPAGLKGGRIQLAASVSSQYVSSILLCAPYAQEAVTLELTGGQVISQAIVSATNCVSPEYGLHVSPASSTLVLIC